MRTSRFKQITNAGLVYDGNLHLIMSLALQFDGKIPKKNEVYK